MATVGHGVGRESGGDGHGDVFPALGAFIGAGIIMGVAVAVGVAELVEQGSGSLLARTLGAGLGAILGLFVGLNRAIWRPGRPLPVREPEPSPEPRRVADPSPQLWDPWLDSGHDVEWISPDSASLAVIEEAPVRVVGSTGLIARRAKVRPRVISPDTGEAIPLEDEIGSMLQAGRTGLVAIAGGPGSGKTTALRHLAALLPPWAKDRVRLVDEPDDPIKAFAGAADRLVIMAAEREQFRAGASDRDLASVNSILASPTFHFSSYHLAAWGRDDLIEYLLAAHWDRCASVMARLRASDDRSFLGGIPELWTVVLDRMARDESIGDVRTALRRELAERLDDQPGFRGSIEEFCLNALRIEHLNPTLSPLPLLPGGGSGTASPAVDLLRLLRHRPVTLLLASDRIATLLEGGCVSSDLDRRLPRELVCETARRIAGNSPAIQRLNDCLNQTDRSAIHPMAASLLHAAAPGWRPAPGCLPRLAGAYLGGVAWSGLRLSGVDLRGAELQGADLSGADLEGSQASRAQLQRANLHRARLNSWVADEAELSRANLGSARARQARLDRADLTGAHLVDASLWRANLEGAIVEDADFTGADLEEAKMRGLKLRLARFDWARFGGADLGQCDLEGMELPSPDFHDADLSGALLTGSRMPEANFHGTDLRDAKLAEVDWPGADLRDADLRDATFHMGSSRSGLVGSPIACEGSRTGFYTDDYDEQDVKPPEEIRKANLRGADLRGANIEGVDFYLVDLRDAQYTPDQAEHFRRCRAILGG